MWVLIVVSIVSLVVRRIKLPYTLGLIFVGLLISAFQLNQFVGVTVTTDLLTRIAPEIFLVIFLPGLLFEGAMNLEADYFFKNIKSITSFAVIGVLLSVFASGSVLHFILNIPWEVSLLISAMIVPTDPVAVLSIFKKLGAPKKLAVLLEGESLFNDGTGIVIFRVLLALILTGSFSLANGVLQFLTLVLGGLIIGSFSGYFVSKVISKIDDNFTQITLTTVLAYGSYLIAEHLHFSGVISVVVAGIILGERGIKNISAESKLEIMSFWTYAGFLLNSFVFLLIGLELKIADLLVYLVPIAAAFTIVLLARAVSIYLISVFINNVDDSRVINNVDESIPGKWQHVLVWGGLHGGLSMVLALSLPTSNFLLSQWRPFIITTVFGVVFLSLVFQGTTISFLLNKLGLVKKKPKGYEFDLAQARQYMYIEGEKELMQMRESKIISKKLYEKYHFEQQKKIKKTEDSITKLISENPELKDEQEREIQVTLLSAHKTALIRGYKQGFYSKEVMDTLVDGINERLAQLNKKINQ